VCVVVGVGVGASVGGTGVSVLVDWAGVSVFVDWTGVVWDVLHATNTNKNNIELSIFGNNSL
jgi:hypothetical protein